MNLTPTELRQFNRRYDDLIAQAPEEVRESLEAARDDWKKVVELLKDRCERSYPLHIPINRPRGVG